MRTPARIAGHPIHPILVTIPVGLWIFSFVCDLGYLATGIPGWNVAAYYAVGGGCIGAVLAAAAGLVDGLFLRKSPIFRTVLTHMALNSLALVIFIMSFLSRSIEASNPWSVALSTLGVIAVFLGGWFGGHLVFVQGVGVEPPDQHRHPIKSDTENVRRSA